MPTSGGTSYIKLKTPTAIIITWYNSLEIIITWYNSLAIIITWYNSLAITVTYNT
jgi:hypothetical protein